MMTLCFGNPSNMGLQEPFNIRLFHLGRFFVSHVDRAIISFHNGHQKCGPGIGDLFPMSGKSWSKKPDKKLKRAKLDSPSLSSLLSLPPLESGGIISSACPARTLAGAVAIEKGLTGNGEALHKEPRPLLADPCYSCVAISHCYPMAQWQRCLLAQGPRLMVDTLQLRFEVHLENSQTQGWRYIKIEEDGFSHGSRHKLYKLDNGSTIHLTYYSNYYHMGSNLFIRISLPKLLHGDNFLLAPSLEHAIRYVTLLLNSIPDLPELDPWKAELSEFHVTYNFFVGDLAPYYPKAFHVLHFPHRKPVHYPGEGIEYPSGQSCCRFYDKGVESNNPAAKGFIRQETALRTKAIRKVFNEYINLSKKPTLRDVSEGLMYYILKKDQEILSIFNRSFGGYDMAQKVLCDQFGPTKGKRLYEILKAQQELGSRKQIAQATGYSLRSIQKAFKDIADVGISPLLVDELACLPPLVLPPPPGFVDDANVRKVPIDIVHPVEIQPDRRDGKVFPQAWWSQPGM